MLDKTAVLESLTGHIGERVIIDQVFYGIREMKSGTP